jgi:vacuolar-type H+-ATPase subunit F/Vma7
MGRLAVIGEPSSVVGFELAGTLVLEADGPDAVRAAWDGLPDDVVVVILSRAAAAVLDTTGASRLTPLRVELPS